MSPWATSAQMDDMDHVANHQKGRHTYTQGERIVDTTSLLVVGAGPYGLAVAARARERGIDTVIVGHPLGFWTGPYARWHVPQIGDRLASRCVGRAHLRGLRRRTRAPSQPNWIRFRSESSSTMRRGFRGRSGSPFVISSYRPSNKAMEEFVASFEDGSQIGAERVVAAPGNGYFAHVPEWAAALPAGYRLAHKRLRAI